MLKLFSWLRSPSRFQSRLIDIPSSLYCYYCSHSLNHISGEEDFDDPPFSPVKTKNKEKKVEKEKGSSKNGGDFPVNSDLPFDFRYSYSENPGIEPIGFRETPKFSPFGPGRLDRKWTGICAPAQESGGLEKVAEERKAVLGDQLTEEEIAELVEKYRHSNCSRQINLGSFFEIFLLNFMQFGNFLCSFSGWVKFNSAITNLHFLHNMKLSCRKNGI